ncbi:hypothetical protein [Gemmiger sp.]
MAENIGPKIGIEGEAAFKQSLKNIVQQTKALDAEFKMVTSTFSKNSDAQAKLRAQAEVLGRQLANQKSRVDLLRTAYDSSEKKLKELKTALEEATKKSGENSTEAQAANAAYQRQIGVVAKAKTEWMNAATAANKMADQLADTEDALSKAGQETQSTEEETKKLGAAMEDTGKKSSVFGDVLKANLLGDAIKAAIGKTVDMIKELGSAFVSLAKSSLGGYSNYEQLVGGVKTLFGTEAGSVEEYAQSVDQSVAEVTDKYNSLLRGQETVLKNARDSWKTTGLSANAYMETVTSFAASLVSSLGGDTEKAAQYADMALVDMSDNANKMGTNMTSIQDAYQGFAKQNYTMLDNLKLGYGGTKTEMERLVADAAALTDVQDRLGVTVDANSLSFENIVAAIHVVQDNMGIMGTTAREAESTIQGSVNGMKAAWENFLTGMADPEQDFDALVQNLVQSIQTAASNIVPRLQEIIPTLIEGLGELAGQALPLVQDTAAQMAESLVEGMSALGASLAELVPQLLESVSTMLPELGAAALQIVQGLATGILEAAPTLLESGAELVAELGRGLAENVPLLLAQAMPMLADFASGLRENAGQLVDAGISFILNLVQGLADGLPTLIEYVPQIVSDIAGIINDNMPKILMAGLQIIGTLLQGIWNALPDLLANLPQILIAIADVITAFNWLNIGKQVMDFFGNGIMSMAGGIKDAITGTLDGGIAYIKTLPEKFLGWGKDMIDGMIRGIVGKLDDFRRAILNVASMITSMMHFSRPDVGPLRNYEQWMPDFMAGLADGIDANSWRVEDAITRLTGRMGVQLTAAQTGGAIVNQTINFGYEVQAPDVVAREVRRITTSGLAGA